jgi:hypothetical protein
MPGLRYYPDIFLDALTKTTTNIIQSGQLVSGSKFEASTSQKLRAANN